MSAAIASRLFVSCVVCSSSTCVGSSVDTVLALHFQILHLYIRVLPTRSRTILYFSAHLEVCAHVFICCNLASACSALVGCSKLSLDNMENVWGYVKKTMERGNEAQRPWQVT